MLLSTAHARRRACRGRLLLGQACWTTCAAAAAVVARLRPRVLAGSRGVPRAPDRVVLAAPDPSAYPLVAPTASGVALAGTALACRLSDSSTASLSRARARAGGRKLVGEQRSPESFSRLADGRARAAYEFETGSRSSYGWGGPRRAPSSARTASSRSSCSGGSGRGPRASAPGRDGVPALVKSRRSATPARRAPSTRSDEPSPTRWQRSSSLSIASYPSPFGAETARPVLPAGGRRTSRRHPRVSRTPARGGAAARSGGGREEAARRSSATSACRVELSSRRPLLAEQIGPSRPQHRPLDDRLERRRASSIKLLRATPWSVGSTEALG